MQKLQDVQLAAEAFRSAISESAIIQAMPATGLILGTGLSDLGHKMNQSYESMRIPFSMLPGFPKSTVESHAGSFALTELGGLPILVQQGRVHLYEGYSPDEVCMGVRLMHLLGIKRLIITNAAGALNPNYQAGSIMCLADFINFTGRSPLTGENVPEFGERFPDMSQPFDPGLIRLANTSALKLGIRLENGVYIGVHGPEMETPAQTRMFRQWGADAVGMSTVLEIIAARHCGMKVLGFSCLTNKNLPDCMEPAPLVKVLAMANECGKNLASLLEDLCFALAQERPSLPRG